MAEISAYSVGISKAADGSEVLEKKNTHLVEIAEQFLFPTCMVKSFSSHHLLSFGSSWSLGSCLVRPVLWRRLQVERAARLLRFFGRRWSASPAPLPEVSCERER